MPDKRVHRGRHPADDQLFASSAWPRLRDAVADVSWLLSRGYAEKASLALVGDRYSLTARQRAAVMRSGCSDRALARRRSCEVDTEALAGATLLLDGYNVLTTVEVALAGGVILVGRDGCYRDMASMHGTFRRVQETAPAVRLLGETLSRWGVARCRWYLDRPVSNSGRLRAEMLNIAVEHDWAWEVELVANPDAVLSASDQIIASADSAVLDRCQRWFNLIPAALRVSLPETPVVRLDGATD